MGPQISIIIVFSALFVSPNYVEAVEKFVCEGQYFDVQCETGTYLKFTNAWYGRNSTKWCSKQFFINVMSTSCVNSRTAEIPLLWLDKNCGGRTDCQLLVDNIHMGDDPCIGTFKFLYVQFECSSKVTEAYPYYTYTCQDEVANLVCGEGEIVQIRAVQFGRSFTMLGTDSQVTALPKTFCWSPFYWFYAFISGIFSSECQDQGESFRWIERICRGRRVCTFKANIQTADANPCPFVNKVLIVEWACSLQPAIIPVG